MPRKKLLEGMLSSPSICLCWRKFLENICNTGVQKFHLWDDSFHEKCRLKVQNHHENSKTMQLCKKHSSLLISVKALAIIMDYIDNLLKREDNLNFFHFNTGFHLWIIFTFWNSISKKSRTSFIMQMWMQKCEKKLKYRLNKEERNISKLLWKACFSLGKSNLQMYSLAFQTFFFF